MRWNRRPERRCAGGVGGLSWRVATSAPRFHPIPSQETAAFWLRPDSACRHARRYHQGPPHECGGPSGQPHRRRGRPRHRTPLGARDVVGSIVAIFRQARTGYTINDSATFTAVLPVTAGDWPQRRVKFTTFSWNVVLANSRSWLGLEVAETTPAARSTGRLSPLPARPARGKRVAAAPTHRAAQPPCRRPRRQPSAPSGPSPAATSPRRWRRCSGWAPAACRPYRTAARGHLQSGERAPARARSPGPALRLLLNRWAFTCRLGSRTRRNADWSSSARRRSTRRRGGPRFPERPETSS